MSMNPLDGQFSGPGMLSEFGILGRCNLFIGF